MLIDLYIGGPFVHMVIDANLLSLLSASNQWSLLVKGVSHGGHELALNSTAILHTPIRSQSGKPILQEIHYYIYIHNITPSKQINTYHLGRAMLWLRVSFLLGFHDPELESFDLLIYIQLLFDDIRGFWYRNEPRCAKGF